MNKPFDSTRSRQPVNAWRYRPEPSPEPMSPSPRVWGNRNIESRLAVCDEVVGPEGPVPKDLRQCRNGHFGSDARGRCELRFEAASSAHQSSLDAELSEQTRSSTVHPRGESNSPDSFRQRSFRTNSLRARARPRRGKPFQIGRGRLEVITSYGIPTPPIGGAAS
jgi:hypothetical protein